jgi:hypothetical protein
MLDVRTQFLTSVEAVTLCFFLDRIISKPGNMISDFLYADLHFKLVLTFYVLLHLTVLFLDSKLVVQHAALLFAAFGWAMLLIITIHGSRLWHCLGVAAHCIGVFLFGMLRCAEYTSPWVELISLDIGISLMLAFAYAYLVIIFSENAYIPQHALFLMAQATYAVLVHFDPYVH